MHPPLIIFRHGQTEWNREGIFQGHLDSPLTTMGRQQGAVLADVIAPLIKGREWVAYTSPTGRSSHTARLALGPLGIVPTPDDRLKEVDAGDWSGMTVAEISERAGESFSEDPLLRFFQAPNGESFQAFCARVQSFLDDLTGPTLISTHGITSRVLRGLALGQDLDAMREMEVAQGCVYVVENGKYQRFG